MKVLFLHHQQRRHYREEPGYNDLFLPLRESPHLTNWSEFVYQPILRQFFEYEIRLLGDRAATQMDQVQAWMRANQAFYPCLVPVIETAAPDLIIYSPTYMRETISPLLFQALKRQFPKLRLFTQFWDYDEGNPLWLMFERDIIKASDLVAIGDSFSRFERIRNRQDVYASFENTDAVVWLPARPNPHVFRPRSEPKTVEVCVIGSSEGFRAELIADLSRHYGPRFVHAGGVMENDRFVSYEEYASLICRAKIVVNSQTVPSRVQIKARTREVLACRGFLLDQRNAETERFFAGSGVALWNDFDDLHAKIDYYLAHDQEREALATTTHQWYLEHFPVATYFDEILDHLRRRAEKVG